MNRIVISIAVLALCQVQAAVNKDALSNWYSGLNANKVIRAINCGSKEEIIDLSGV